MPLFDLLEGHHEPITLYEDYAAGISLSRPGLRPTSTRVPPRNRMAIVTALTRQGLTLVLIPEPKRPRRYNCAMCRRSPRGHFPCCPLIRPPDTACWPSADSEGSRLARLRQPPRHPSDVRLDGRLHDQRHVHEIGHRDPAAYQAIGLRGLIAVGWPCRPRHRHQGLHAVPPLAPGRGADPDPLARRCRRGLFLEALGCGCRSRTFRQCCRRCRSAITLGAALVYGDRIGWRRMTAILAGLGRRP